MLKTIALVSYDCDCDTGKRCTTTDDKFLRDATTQTHSMMLCLVTFIYHGVAYTLLSIVCISYKKTHKLSYKTICTIYITGNSKCQSHILFIIYSIHQLQENSQIQLQENSQQSTISESKCPSQEAS